MGEVVTPEEDLNKNSCRICLKSQYPAYVKITDEILTIINFCFGVPVISGPLILCTKCAGSIAKFNSFKKKLIKSNDTWKSYSHECEVSVVKDEDEIKLEIESSIDSSEAPLCDRELDQNSSENYQTNREDSEILTEQFSKQISERISKEISEQISKQISKRISEQISEQIAEKIAEQIADKISVTVTKQISIESDIDNRETLLSVRESDHNSSKDDQTSTQNAETLTEQIAEPIYEQSSLESDKDDSESIFCGTFEDDQTNRQDVEVLTEQISEQIAERIDEQKSLLILKQISVELVTNNSELLLCGRNLERSSSKDDQTIRQDAKELSEKKYEHTAKQISNQISLPIPKQLFLESSKYSCETLSCGSVTDQNSSEDDLTNRSDAEALTDPISDPICEQICELPIPKQFSVESIIDNSETLLCVRTLDHNSSSQDGEVMTEQISEHTANPISDQISLPIPEQLLVESYKDSYETLTCGRESDYYSFEDDQTNGPDAKILTDHMPESICEQTCELPIPKQCSVESVTDNSETLLCVRKLDRNSSKDDEAIHQAAEALTEQIDNQIFEQVSLPISEKLSVESDENNSETLLCGRDLDHNSSEGCQTNSQDADILTEQMSVEYDTDDSESVLYGIELDFNNFEDDLTNRQDADLFTEQIFEPICEQISEHDVIPTCLTQDANISATVENNSKLMRENKEGKRRITYKYNYEKCESRQKYFFIRYLVACDDLGSITLAKEKFHICHSRSCGTKVDRFYSKRDLTIRQYVEQISDKVSLPSSEQISVETNKDSRKILLCGRETDHKSSEDDQMTSQDAEMLTEEITEPICENISVEYDTDDSESILCGRELDYNSFEGDQTNGQDAEVFTEQMSEPICELSEQDVMPICLSQDFSISATVENNSKSESKIIEGEKRITYKHSYEQPETSLSSMSSESKEEVNEHIAKHFANNDLECKIRGFQGTDFAEIFYRFIEKYSFVNHMKTHYAVKEHACDICGKAFTTSGYLKVHLTTVHTSEAPVKCSHCAREYKCQFYLDQHIRRYENVNETFQCEVCLKFYANERRLKMHYLKMHFRKGLFVCNICNDTYTAIELLARHKKKTHPSSKQLKCTACKRFFASNLMLLQHKCVKCDRQLRSKSKLIAYSKRHKTVKK